MSYIDKLNYSYYHRGVLDLNGWERTQLESSGDLRYCISECGNTFCSPILLFSALQM